MSMMQCGSLCAFVLHQVVLFLAKGLADVESTSNTNMSSNTRYPVVGLSKEKGWGDDPWQ